MRQMYARGRSIDRRKSSFALGAAVLVITQAVTVSGSAAPVDVRPEPVSASRDGSVVHTAVCTGPDGVAVVASSGAGGSLDRATASPAMNVVPIVLDVDTGSAHYTTELALTNAGSTAQTVTLRYTPSLGARLGGGTVSVEVPAGQQVVYQNVLSTLRTLGLPIPGASASSPQGGTLAVTYDPDVGAVFATARTTSATAAPHPVGSAGLAYGALRQADACTGRGAVFGLRSNATDRSNLAVYNAGSEPVTVRVTLHSGTGDGRSAVAADGLVLPAFGWTQLNDPLRAAGMDNGWAVVERTSTGGAFGAYGVINDNATNDGSFVELLKGASTGAGLTVPVLVETAEFASELVVANKGTAPARLELGYVESLSPAAGAGGLVVVELPAGRQRIIPDAVDFLRTSGAAIGPKGAGGYAGALRVAVSGASLDDVYVGARTAAASGAGGRFGLFTPPVYAGREAGEGAAIYGLKADALSRTNVAVLNAGADGAGPVTLGLEVRDGSAGGAVRGSTTVELRPGQWAQPGGFFGGSGVSNGYVTVRRTAGTAPWVAYGVVNDGGAPGRRTGDGAYVPMVRQECSATCAATVPGTASKGKTVQLDASATLSGCDGSATWDWDFGDGSARSSLRSPAHTWASEGVFTWTVTVSVAGVTKCSRTGTITIGADTSIYDGSWVWREWQLFTDSFTFTVSGGTVSKYDVMLYNGSVCGSGVANPKASVPITGTAFSIRYSSTSQQGPVAYAIDGTFDSATTAHGTAQASGWCSTQKVSWTAKKK